MKKILIFLVLILGTLPCFAKYVNYSRIDWYAKHAPLLENEEDLPELVNYLIYPYKTDKEKARSILAWIVYYIDYDEYVFHRMEEYRKENNKRFGVKRLPEIPTNDILKIRAGVCADIAKLYKEMGNIAKLDVEIVEGIDNQCSLKEIENGGCRHAWNVVKIDGEWQYVDPTWAMGNAGKLDSTSLRLYEKELTRRTKGKRNLKARQNRYVHDEWFLTDAQEMIKTHFPDEERWQLQKKKITIAKFLGVHEQTYKTEKKAQERIRKRHEEHEAYKARERQKANMR